jgi:Tfp pilus assembly protein PilN
MPQQINLSSPLLLKPKQYFSAQTMLFALVVFLVLGGVLSGVVVWNLQKATKGYGQTMTLQSREIESLQAAIKVRKASAAPADAALVAQSQERRRAVEQRKLLLQALQQGMFRPGEGHSDRLQLVARSIPAPVWVTEVKADASRFELTGFTLEPSALNEWVSKLALSPLMQGLKLATVKVENTAAPPRAVWSFNLVSVQPPPPAVAVVNAAVSQP